MIQFYFNTGPNPMKIGLFVEETGMPYEVIPLDTMKGEQHTADFRKINPNAKAPAIVDTDGAGGSTRVFDSTAILLYLAEKSGQLMGSAADRGEMLSWLMFIASGLGPYSGQSVHFHRAVPEEIPYARNRYRREAQRHYQVMDDHLAGREFFIGGSYGIVDISAWGWVDRAGFVLGDGGIDAFPNVKKWFAGIDARPAVARTRAISKDLTFKRDMDDDARRAMFPSNFAA